jgi:Fe-S-cluster-containing dehydrogenase component
VTRWAMVNDLRRCVGCQSCTIACQIGNSLPLGMFWNLVTTVGPVGDFPNLGYYHIPRPCFHCANPPCVGCCPTGASSQRADGIVLVDATKCIGCRSCVMACPYGARTHNKELGVVQKCTFCVDSIKLGREPYCVSTCHQRARVFGDLDDPNSEVSRLVREENPIQLMPELGTEPRCFYLLPQRVRK